MSGEDESIGMFSGIVGITRRDLLLAWKRPGDVLNPLFFFAMVAALFPLAVGPSPEQLKLSGPAVLWVAALLSMLLSLNSLFLSDYEDGSLDQMLVSPIPLSALRAGQDAGTLVDQWAAFGCRFSRGCHNLPDAIFCDRVPDAHLAARHHQPQPAGFSGCGTDSRIAPRNSAP